MTSIGMASSPVPGAGLPRAAAPVDVNLSFMQPDIAPKRPKGDRPCSIFRCYALAAMIAKPILALAATVAASVSPPGDYEGAERGRLLFSCIGTIRTADAPETAVVAEAFVDLVSRRVDGFGVGSASVLRVTDSVITFGNAAGRQQVRG